MMCRTSIYPTDKQLAAALRCATPHCEGRVTLILPGEGGVCSSCALLAQEFDDREAALKGLDPELDAPLSLSAGADRAADADADEAPLDVEAIITSICGAAHAVATPPRSGLDGLPGRIDQGLLCLGDAARPTWSQPWIVFAACLAALWPLVSLPWAGALAGTAAMLALGIRGAR